MSDASFTAIFCTQPPFDTPFPNSPTTLAEFLIYLEGRGFVQPALECHSIKRIVDKNSAAAMPTFKITSVEKVGFKTKAASAKGLFDTLTPSCFSSNSKVRLVFRCKFDEKETLVVPQRPVIVMKDNVRLLAKNIIQVTNI